uniref:NADH dehydrogenase subunit 6 n=1 Tax=Smilium sinense TaxID=1380519 RepID=UPI0021CC8063|nr:NADH dehydrogenase subunit 6 [Smilium sinense]UWM12994.1 NADH dehydrogenase subunit 6 [Smilium sinense]
MVMSLMFLIFALNLLFLFMFHPLGMIFILIMQTFSISVIIFYLLHFPWFSYTLILVFLGGMLILFMYMSNIASNEMFKVNFMISIPITVLPLMGYFMNMMMQNMTLESSTFGFESFNKISILKMFSWPIMPVTLLMAMYIILTLLVVVKISKMQYGPLRVI